jgi:hypothetical protein
MPIMFIFFSLVNESKEKAKDKVGKGKVAIIFKDWNAIFI